ncbi:MAG: histidine kinase dimerization/phospho-acceptor domain-containing protein, partial [Candidatus Omnitrophica bacterium]|nr:histidine kinase dimerization/phospho-acceptor domain-containing protein [Candidatus Omnitrophota bacterium]
MQKEEEPLRGTQAEKIASIREFAVGLTDEMNNLLIVISGRLKFLLEQKTIDKDARENLELISNCADRLSVMVNRILKFAMNMPHKLEDLNINEVIENASTLLAYYKECPASIIIEKDLAKDIPLIKSDFNQLQEVFLDLFLSACQAMTGEDSKLSIKTSNFENRYIEVKISDVGPKKKERTHFDLLMCRKIINNYNGSMEIERQDYGTTVI